jgi:hypothetical protein
MSANDNWMLPTWHQQWDIFAANRLSEHSAAQHVSQRTVRAEPHFLQIELYKTNIKIIEGFK